MNKTLHNRFFELLGPLYGKLEQFSLNMSRNRDVARDIVSETVLAAYDSFHTLKSEKAFLSFLFTIASRVYYSRLNKKIKENIKDQDIDELFCTNSSPEVFADVQLLYDALDQLPIHMKEAILLFDISGFSYKEISEIQGISIDNVKVRLHRGRNMLATILQVNNDMGAAVGTGQCKPAGTAERINTGGNVNG